MPRYRPLKGVLNRKGSGHYAALSRAYTVNLYPMNIRSSQYRVRGRTQYVPGLDDDMLSIDK